LGAPVAEVFSFLFGNPFIYGTLLAGKVTSLWRGAILPHGPHWLWSPLSVGVFFFLASGLHELIIGVSIVE